MFLVAVPIAALAFLASWLIPQVELKQWPEADAGVPEADMAVPGATVAEAILDEAGEDPVITQEALEPQDASRTDP